MALPTSGALTLADIQTEFGGSNPISLSEYYAGGSYVAAGTSGTNGAIPSSGTISISNFYGTSAYIPPTNLTQKAIFGYGYAGSTPGVRINNLVSSSGVVGTDNTGVGTQRAGPGAAGYGSDKAIFAYGTYMSGGMGFGISFYNLSNLVSNLGVVASDTTGVGTVRWKMAAAGYGSDKAIFGYGENSSVSFSMTNLVSNAGVVATDTTGVGTVRGGLSAACYGTDKAIFLYGEWNNISNLVSNTGVVATDTSIVGTSRTQGAAAGYRKDKAIFAFGLTGSPLYSNTNISNLISNSGAVATDTTGVGSVRYALAAAGYAGDKAIFGYGYNSGYKSMTNLVSNGGVVATDTTGVGTARGYPAAASYSS